MVPEQVIGGRGRSLPRHCSIGELGAPLDRIVFHGSATAIGEFRCPVGHPAFCDSGPIARAIVVFPRSGVWIRHEGSRAFVADPNIVTIYNRAQRYERAPLSADGDRSDWFSVSDDLARDLSGAWDPAARDRADRPFGHEWGPSTPALYLRQRRLVRDVAGARADALETEEEIVAIVSTVMALAHRCPPRPLASRRSAAVRRRELAEQAKAELVQSLAVNRSAVEIAAAVGTSVYHLCRVFRAHTGHTMHQYRTGLRMRIALERLGDWRDGATLSQLAHELGFASHAHFVRLCRRHVGLPPAAVRALLGMRRVES